MRSARVLDSFTKYIVPSGLGGAVICDGPIIATLTCACGSDRSRDQTLERRRPASGRSPAAF
ncbi:hypothetical protein J2S73_000285 [Amorphus orientalis]|uniref:Uncharacterized protein n=1 Tax=Amorphus orientalis TaxID=649198 RepID=A0AAE3VL05_9HYPH|nr:hypothetical protein [Amorphus orientalis]